MVFNVQHHPAPNCSSGLKFARPDRPHNARCLSWTFLARVSTAGRCLYNHQAAAVSNTEISGTCNQLDRPSGRRNVCGPSEVFQVFSPPRFP